MKSVLDMKLEELPGLSFMCSCGRNHSVNIKKLVVRSDITEGLVTALMPFKESKLFVLADANTYAAFGKTVTEKLLEAGFLVESLVYEPGDTMLLPDERAIGRLLVEAGQDTSMVLAVGSGVITDIARIVSHRTGKLFAVAATAPSMDGYASVVSSLLINGKKHTYHGQYPYAIFADTSIMRNAPMDMIRAGYGDVLGKLTALADWRLSRIVNGEYYCETTAELVKNAVDKCIESSGGLASRDEKSIHYLIEALILTGISIGFAGVSRPASGTEHQLAHYWEMKAIEAGHERALHGNAVGAGTVVAAALYELAAPMLPEGIKYPSAELVIKLLEKAGACTNPAGLGVGRDMFADGMRNAMHINDRYTILRFCHDKGKLKQFTEVLARRFYD
ncbi:MAG: sn-glycerol-1-phosphate dehydrogenase [Acetivibrionales bacterium]|jgi:glycerol-1-phosphate dehydrogenase [NAD(P)+]